MSGLVCQQELLSLQLIDTLLVRSYHGGAGRFHDPVQQRFYLGFNFLDLGHEYFPTILRLSKAHSFLRFYSFIAQVVDLRDTALERLHLYGSWLKRVLPTRQAPHGEDVTDDMLQLEAYRLQKVGDPQNASLGKDDTLPLSPIDRFGANPYTEEESKALSEIIDAFNARHGTAFTEADYVRFEAVNAEMLNDPDLVAMLRNNDPRDVRPHYDEEFRRRAIRAFQRDKAMRNAFMQDREAQDMLMRLMFRRAMRGAGRLD